MTADNPFTEEQWDALNAIWAAMEEPMPAIADKLADALEKWPEHAETARLVRESRCDADRIVQILDAEFC